MPRHSPPSVPQKPWTEIAPHGSSTFKTRSLKSTPRQTTVPAITPIMTELTAVTNAQDAVIATSPASIPLQAMEMSGLPNIMYQTTSAAAEPAHAAKFVLTAIDEIRKSVAASVEPGLKPIQP